MLYIFIRIHKTAAPFALISVVSVADWTAVGHLMCLFARTPDAVHEVINNIGLGRAGSS